MNKRIKKKKDPVGFKKKCIEIKIRKREKEFAKALRDSTCSVSDLSNAFKILQQACIPLQEILNKVADTLRFLFEQKGDD